MISLLLGVQKVLFGYGCSRIVAISVYGHMVCAMAVAAADADYLSWHKVYVAHG